MKRVAVVLVAALAVQPVVRAAAPAAPAADPPPTDPQALVQSVTERVLATLRSGAVAGDEAALREKVRELILPHLDFVAMSKLVLGKHWRRATAEQREAFVAAFRRLLVDTYESALTKYRDEEVVFLPFRPGRDPERLAEVRCEIRRAGGPPIPIVYSLRFKPEDGWKVYDIAIEGVSLVTNYRSSFSQEIDRNGLDALIARLEARGDGEAVGEGGAS
ncbi:MAG: hypothetical protein KatS3mg121_0554 [Gammaproteobacteria bacterium]|nr:MAG: hypothetical protein KatS3mg121_0554 [Gammaproteobacteria bacterium]